MIVAILVISGTGLQAQTKRSDNFRARYEPKMTGGYTLVNSVADALVLQCYESESFAPFGHELTMDQWRAIGAVKEVYDGLLFTTHAVAVNLVYQSVQQLQDRTLLSTDVPPMVLPVTVEGLAANADGLYHLSDLDAHMANVMAEYEAIEDVPAAVSAIRQSASQSAAIYNLQGQRLDTLQRGVNIVGGTKNIVR